MKLAIVGIFYDGYYDMWEDFLDLFRKKWPDCPYPLFIINQEKELAFNTDYNVTVLHAGADAEYSRKVQMAVDNIDADYYLFLLDDFFFGEKLSKDVLRKALDFISKNNVRYYGFHLDLFVKSHLEQKVVKIKPSDEYTLVSAYAIWKKDFLRKCIGSDNYNAWIFEGVYALAPKVHTEEFLTGCYYDQTNPLAIYHGALQGKMLRQTVNYFNSQGYYFRSNREVLGRKASFQHWAKIQAIKILPRNIKNSIRKHFNTSSVIEKYSSQIQQEINNLGLN